MEKIKSEATMECQECGRMFKWINHMHLEKHNMTVDEYKIKHKINFTEGLTDDNLKLLRRELGLKRVKDGIVNMDEIRKMVKKPKTSQGKSPGKRARMSPRSDEVNKKRSELMKKKFKEDEGLYERTVRQLRSIERCSSIKKLPKKIIKQIESLIKEGFSDHEVGAKFRIHKSTIQRYRTNVMGIKLELHAPLRRSQRKDKVCPICKKKFVCYEYKGRNPQKTCSNKCKSKRMSKPNHE